jgi:hypothetical protein
MADKKKNWLLIILGIVIFVVIVGIAVIAGGVYWFYHQMDIHTTRSADAQQQFESVRARFQGQVPYIEVSITDNHEETTVHRELEKPTRTTLTRLRMAIYDEREHQFVQMGLPFWLLRLGGNKPINLRQGGSGFDPGVRLTVTTEDLERRGPGLVLDTTGRHGEHVLVWAE